VTLASLTALQRRDDETNTKACPRLLFKLETPARYSYDFQVSIGSLQLNVSLNEQYNGKDRQVVPNTCLALPSLGNGTEHMTYVPLYYKI
jgi:hypothetical protein